jgi:hypothetical protein
LPLVCHAPFELHVCVSVPQLPHGAGCVWPGAHTPWHALPTHVWFVHGTGVPHSPETHGCTPLPEHWVCPAEHAPTQTPPSEQVPLVHATGLPYCPQPPHVSTPPPPHCVDPGEHAGAAAHEHEPHAHDAVHVAVP